MNKSEFLSELRRRLNGLPQQECDNALAFYEEYFSEAGNENEAEVIRKIGSPAAVAAKIIGEYAVNNAESGFERERKKSKPEKKGVPLWLLLLAIFASPITLPVSIAIFCVVIMLCFTLFMIFFALGLSGVVVFAGGIVTIVVSIALLFTHFATGLFFIGYALLLLAAGAALVLVVIKLTKLASLGIQKMLGKFLVRKGSK